MAEEASDFLSYTPISFSSPNRSVCQSKYTLPFLRLTLRRTLLGLESLSLAMLIDPFLGPFLYFVKFASRAAAATGTIGWVTGLTDTPCKFIRRFTRTGTIGDPTWRNILLATFCQVNVIL